MLRLARERIAKAGLDGRASGELRDYRDLQGHSVYDKIASVGMFEHVGLKNLPQALGYVSEPTFRVGRLYMAACALEFESGEIGVYQVLASKRNQGTASMALTRKHLYPHAHRSETALAAQTA